MKERTESKKSLMKTMSTAGIRLLHNTTKCTDNSNAFMNNKMNENTVKNMMNKKRRITLSYRSADWRQR